MKLVPEWMGIMLGMLLRGDQKYDRKELKKIMQSRKSTKIGKVFLNQLRKHQNGLI